MKNALFNNPFGLAVSILLLAGSNLSTVRHYISLKSANPASPSRDCEGAIAFVYVNQNKARRLPPEKERKAEHENDEDQLSGETQPPKLSGLAESVP
jgi:hypothetical protein